MSIMRIVAKKEFRDGVRDKRALLSAFFFPLSAPLFIYFLLNAVIEMSQVDETVSVPIYGADAAPGLIAYLTEAGIEVDHRDPQTLGEVKSQVANQTLDFALMIPEDFQDTMASYRPPDLLIVSDSSRNDIAAQVGQLRRVLNQYNQGLISLRLIARGVSPKVTIGARPISIDVASDQKRTASVLNFIPIYVLMAAFVAGLGIAIDGTAGERERKSLEPLLINPIRPIDIIFGKWFASGTFALLGMLATLVLCVVAMFALPIEEIGLSFEISTKQALALLMVSLPVPYTAASLQILLGLFAKSFKDAQSYIGILVILPMVPVIIRQFMPFVTEPWMAGIPIFAQSVLMMDVLAGSGYSFLSLGVALVSGFVASALLCLVAARLLTTERMIQS
ncbi:MAG: ABC transporter permease [Pseudomonadota bacterium]|jgi:sodium transport system permease protein|nr:ABC transporter permease [Pseudomonadota bacterium]|tara:strand:- start:529 stop:1704 length:1176 start_codon:yes stop_codon:yes gene_type:complete